MRRRAFLLGSIASFASGCAAALSEPETAAVDRLGRFEHAMGRPGVVVAAPHGTADAGTLAIAKEICAKSGAGGVFVTGFWESQTRRRINVNRDTEQTTSLDSRAVDQRHTPRAAYVNARYTALVREVAQGPLRAFFELHSNSNARYETAVEVATRGVGPHGARQFKERFLAARERSIPADGPKLGIHVSPADAVWFNYLNSTSIDWADQGFLIELPNRVVRETRWRDGYARVLTEIVTAMVG
jgi:hypothetical protein